MRAEMTQEEFELKWKPIPGDDFSPPACFESMILLKAFADAHPDSFQFIRPEDYVHFENDAFAGMDEWDVFARHCLSCHACNELQGLEKITMCGRNRRKSDKQGIASFSCQWPSIDSLMIMPND